MTISSWLAHFEIEDVVLFVWLAVIAPLLQLLLGGALSGLNLGDIQPGIPNDIFLGAVIVLSTALALVCIVTRAPGEANSEVLNVSSAFGYAHLPMLAATSIMMALGLTLLKLDQYAVPMFCVIFGLFALGYMAHKRMPTLDFSIRRILMTPFIILTTTIFSATINPMFSGVNPKGLLQIVQNELGQFEFGLLLAGVLVYYLMFIFAPRVIAGASGGWLQWSARLALYIVGLILNIGILQAL